jgi:hypothetical protein
MMHDGNKGISLVNASTNFTGMELEVFKRSVIRSGMSPESFIRALTQTSMSSLVSWQQVDLELLLLSAERFGLNPLGREIFMIRGDDRPDESPMIVLGVDGWV